MRSGKPDAMDAAGAVGVVPGRRESGTAVREAGLLARDVALHARDHLAFLPLTESDVAELALLQRSPDRARGRSALVDVPETSIDGSPVRAVKLKGVGVCGPDGTPAAASARSYFDGGARRWLHVDFDDDGRLLARPADDRPTGALMLGRARNEDAMLARVRAAGLPAPVPLGYGEFLHLSFRGRRTGFVLIGLADPGDRRLGEEAAAVLDACARPQAGRPDAPLDAARWLAAWARRTAALERRLHACGLAGAGPHLGNFSAAGDEVVLHDLDALVPLPEDREPRLRSMGYRLRDYYVLAASVGRRAYSPALRSRRAEILRAVGEGYFGARPELDDLEPFDHLRFWTVLQRRGRLTDLPAPLLSLMRSAVRADERARHVAPGAPASAVHHPPRAADPRARDLAARGDVTR